MLLKGAAEEFSNVASMLLKVFGLVWPPSAVPPQEILKSAYCLFRMHSRLSTLSVRRLAHPTTEAQISSISSFQPRPFKVCRGLIDQSDVRRDLLVQG